MLRIAGLLWLFLQPILANDVDNNNNNTRSGVGVSLEIENVPKIRMGYTGVIQMRISGDITEEIEIGLRMVDNDTAVLLNSSVSFTPTEVRKIVLKPIHVEGVLLGVTHLQFELNGQLIDSEEISVIVSDSGLNNLFILVMTCMIIVNTINMGAQLDLEVVKEVFKKPIGPGVGFVSQFGLMPGFSFLVGYLLTDDILFRLGLFVLGCCPGGNGSNFWTLLLEGDLNLSIAMTFVSTIAALGMMPLWLYTLGPLFSTDERDIVIPFGNLIMSLFMLILPLLFGMWIRWKWPKAGKIMEKVIIPFTVCTILFIFTAGVYINLFIFQLMTPLMIGAGFIVNAAGYIFGGLLAWIFKLPRAQITAVSIETAFQNGSIAIVLLKMNFPEPLGELAAVAPVAQLLITGTAALDCPHHSEKLSKML